MCVYIARNDNVINPYDRDFRNSNVPRGIIPVNGKLSLFFYKQTDQSHLPGVRGPVHNDQCSLFLFTGSI